MFVCTHINTYMIITGTVKCCIARANPSHSCEVTYPWPLFFILMSSLLFPALGGFSALLCLVYLFGFFFLSLWRNGERLELG